jgi:hypothetical protein
MSSKKFKNVRLPELTPVLFCLFAGTDPGFILFAGTDPGFILFAGSDPDFILLLI